jgi:hypothetical protein
VQNGISYLPKIARMLRNRNLLPSIVSSKTTANEPFTTKRDNSTQLFYGSPYQKDGPSNELHRSEKKESPKQLLQAFQSLKTAL